jgi:hypothetical protein
MREDTTNAIDLDAGSAPRRPHEPRVATTFSGFIVTYVLREAGVGGVFCLITAAMAVVIVAIAVWGRKSTRT